jgi:hypothetical protein
VLQHFRRHYGNEDSLELERKAEIYWQLRKSKNLSNHNRELGLARRILTDLTTTILDFIK